MAAYHAQSNSFHSQPHPLNPEFYKQMQYISFAFMSSLTLTSIGYHLSKLQYLPNCFDKLLLLPLNQQALFYEKDGKFID